MPRSRSNFYATASVVLLAPLLHAGEPDYGKVAAEAIAAGNLARAKDVCKRWVKSEPTNHRPHVLLGRSYLRAGFLDRATDLISEAGLL